MHLFKCTRILNTFIQELSQVNQNNDSCDALFESNFTGSVSTSFRHLSHPKGAAMSKRIENTQID